MRTQRMGWMAAMLAIAGFGALSLAAQAEESGDKPAEKAAVGTIASVAEDHGSFELQMGEGEQSKTITVTVTHTFALLPGPGRFLAKYLVRADGRPDTISRRIDSSQNRNRETVHTTAIWATATMTNEGLRSVIPYVQATH